MNSTYLLNRVFGAKRTIFKLNNKLIQKMYWSSNTHSNNSGSSSEDEKKSKTVTNESNKKNEDALKKLNNLLKTMIEEDVAVSKSKLDLAKPRNKRKLVNKKEEMETVEVESTEKRMAHAIKNVAETIGGDVKQTESELLMKLLSTSENKTTSNNLNDLVKGMKVVREDSTSHSEQSRAQQVKQILQHVQHTRDMKRDPIKTRVPKVRSEIPLEKNDLFGSEPLGIFTDLANDASEGIQNKTWSKLHERDLKLAVTHPPSNYFQQMILWTEQGKVWKFPIDNEQGLEEEKTIYFTEHVFLEKHLEPWCPRRGPLRHFMELVCVGLSKNPYLTVEAKKEHIEWFRNYFEDKKQLLKEVGVLQDSESHVVNSPKQIE